MKPLLIVAFFVLSGLHAFGRDVVFAGYNVQNYGPLLEVGRKKPGKSAESAAAVIEVVREINPDILGIVEMGSPRQFEEFRSRLTAAGLGYIDAEFVESSDPDRHLALVSRFPIVARHSVTDLSFDANGSREKVRRGILDVTVAIDEHYHLRIIGVHFKSKLEVREGEEILRRNEAHLLRKHIDAILEANPQTRLLVFGDFNDTKNQPTVREVAGIRGTPGALTPLPLEDSVGDRWTHYWHVPDTYSRIDFLFVNKALAREVDQSRSYLYRKPIWKEASDHRPLVVMVKTVDPR
jgi:endonuclease/exonuclease/phosphatase family metal-dependent hydrolase